MTRLTDTIEKVFSGRRTKVFGADDASRARQREGRFTQAARVRNSGNLLRHERADRHTIFRPTAQIVFFGR